MPHLCSSEFITLTNIIFKLQQIKGCIKGFRVVLGQAYRGLTGEFLLLFMILGLCTYELGISQTNQTTKCLRSQSSTKGESWSTAN